MSQILFLIALFGSPALVLALPVAIREKSGRRFFIAWLLALAGVVLPLSIFCFSVFMAPDAKESCQHGWLDCFIEYKAILTPLALWATAALYALEVLRVKNRTARWLVLGIFLGATIAVVCFIFGLICFAFAADGVALFLIVPLYVAVWYSVRAWQLIKASPYGVWNYFWVLAGSLPFWIASLWWSYRSYQSLPDTVDNCFVVTAAGRGHEQVVGPFQEITRHGRPRRVNQQLLTFWQFETWWQARAPRSHARFRHVYNCVGPMVARQITSPWLADAACASLKPLEWTARLLLKITKNPEC
jgi:hypothetical protein